MPKVTPQAAVQLVIWATEDTFGPKTSRMTEVSAVWPLEEEEIKKVKDIFVPWMAAVARLLEML